MHNTDQTKDDLIEMALDALMQLLKNAREEMEKREKGFKGLTKEENFIKTMDYVIENTDKENVKSLAQSMKDDPKTGMKLLDIMTNKTQMIGFEDAKNKSEELIKSLDLITESNNKEEVPNTRLQEEIDKVKGREVAKLATINTRLSTLKAKDYTVLKDIDNEDIKAFSELVEDKNGEVTKRNKDKFMEAFKSLTQTAKLKKEIEKTAEKEQKENDKDQEKELEKEKDKTKDKEVKKEKKREIEMER